MNRRQFRERLLECLGGPWPPGGPVAARVRDVRQEDAYRIESVEFQAEREEAIPALLLLPRQASAARPVPGIAVWHQHNNQWQLGKSEPAGRAGDPRHHTARQLVLEGYAVICPDALGFEQRQNPRLEGEPGERFEFLRYVVQGKCLAWKNILDMRRTIDYFASRPEVDARRLGCYGHSMGSTFTWLVGPWEPRLKCLVGNCCLPTYAAIHRTQILHCFSNFIPGLQAFGDTPDIAALIAPRPLLLNFGERDPGSPIREVREGIQRIRRAYREAGAQENFESFIQDAAGHTLTPQMWSRTRDWFARHLQDP